MKSILLAATAAAFLATGAFAQAISITNVTLNGGAPNQTDYSTAVSATGTANVSPGGTANLTMSGLDYRDRGLNCASANTLQITTKFSLNATDSFTLQFTVAAPDIGTAAVPITGTWNIVAGTGAYSGKGGSGSLNLSLLVVGTDNAVTGFTITGSLTGTLTGTLAPPPSILPAGVVPVFSEVPILQPGGWFSIYGANFAGTTTIWNGGNFLTSLGNTSVKVNNKDAFLWFVSPNQINAQAPDDSPTGCVNVVVNTPNGTATYAVTLSLQQPSFSLHGDGKHVIGVIPTSNGSGAYGGGTYDIVGPTGAFSYPTRPVKRGETVELFGVGFGPVSGSAPAGQAFSGALKTISPVTVFIGGDADPNNNFINPGRPVGAAFAGIVGAGLYQINVTIPPSAPTGDVLIQGGLQVNNPILGDNVVTQFNVYIPVQ